MISLCMVVRDEEALLPACLRSARPGVDEIVVVDTGSRDRTVRIAESFGARVLRMRWRGGFEAPRALSFRRAKGDWILFLDADETVDGRSIRALAAKRADAWRLEQRTYTDRCLLQDWRPCAGEHPREEGRAGTRGWIPYRIVRLFRNLPGLKVEGAHPDVEPWLRAKGFRVRDASVPIHHFKVLKGEDASKARLRQNLRVARRHPRDWRAWRDLGALRFSAAALRRAIRLGGGSECLLLLARVEMDRGRMREAVAALKQVPRSADALCLMGIALGSRRHLERALALRPAHVVALNALGAWHLRRGEPAAARRHLERALSILPGYAPALANLGRL